MGRASLAQVSQGSEGSAEVHEVLAGQQGVDDHRVRQTDDGEVFRPSTESIADMSAIYGG